MLCFCIHFADDDDLSPLPNGQMRLIDSKGTVVAELKTPAKTGALWIADEEWISRRSDKGEIDNDLKDFYEIITSLEDGTYTLEETLAPFTELVMESDVLFEEGSGEIKMKQLYSKVSNKQIKIVNTTETHHFYLYHKKEKRVYFDEVGKPYSKARSTRPAIAKLPKKISNLLSRSYELTSSEIKTLAALTLAIQTLSVAAYVWLVLPLIVVLAASFAGAGNFGAQWLTRNISGYISGWFFNGLNAVYMLATTYPELMNWALSIVFALIPLCFIVYFEEKFAATRINPRNDILEDRPEPVKKGMNKGLMGTARLITDRREMERGGWIKTTPMNHAPLSDTGIYLGCWLASEQSQLACSQVSLFTDGIERAINAPRAFWAKLRHKTTTPWHMPKASWLRPKAECAYVPGDLHTAIFGDTRSGKTRRILLSTIELIHRNPRESSIIFDPKGELFGLLADMLRRMGVEVIVIDISDPARSARYNPLYRTIQAAKSNINEASMLVSELVEGIAPREENEGQSRYFNDGARAYIGSSALYVAQHPTCPESQKNLATAARIIDVYGKPMPNENENTNSNTASFCPWEEILERLPGGTENPCFEKESGARGARDSERQAFVSTTNSFMAMFRDPAIADMTAVTDNPIENVASRRQAVFLTIPSNRTAYEPFSTLFLDQTYSQLEDLAKAGMGGGMAGRLPQRVNFICEEICSIPRWPKLSKACNIGGGYGIRFFLVIQNKALFDAKYRDDSNAILGNCENKVFIKTGDSQITARWLSDYLGKYTCLSETRTVSGSRLLPKLHESITHSPQSRELLTEEEIVRWRADFGAILINKDHTCVIPLPDVSRTPTQHYASLGSKWDNLEKIYAERQARPIRKPTNEQRWYPELKKIQTGHVYTDKERSAARYAFIASLAKSRHEKLAAAGLVKEDKKGKEKKKETWYAWVEPSSGDAWIGTKRSDWTAALAARDNPIYKSGDDKAIVEKWYNDNRYKYASTPSPQTTATIDSSLFGEPG